MVTISDIIFYLFIFLALYVQVFFLVTYFEKKHILKQTRPSLKSFKPVSFIVPCYNEEKTVEHTIASIQNIDYPQDKIFIYIVNDGSRDKTLNVLQQYANNPHIIILDKENGGKHSALNLALPHIQTEFVCSFDADTYIMPDALTNALAYFEEDPTLDALGGAVLIEEPKTIVQKAQSIEYQMFSYTKKMLGLLGGVLVVPGAFSLFKTESLRRAGGYKHGHLLEDLELTYRMQSLGFNINHSHNSFVYTKGPDSISALFKQRLRWSYGYINNTYDYRKAILNKKYGNFGMFTLPMTIIAYPAILQIFVLFWYNAIQFFSRKYIEVQALGIESLTPTFSFDFFFIDTTTSSFLTILLFGSIFLAIYLGKRISHVKKWNIVSVFWFVVVYSMMVPLWTLKALYNTLTNTKTQWGRDSFN